MANQVATGTGKAFAYGTGAGGRSHLAKLRDGARLCNSALSALAAPERIRSKNERLSALLECRAPSRSLAKCERTPAPVSYANALPASDASWAAKCEPHLAYAVRESLAPAPKCERPPAPVLYAKALPAPVATWLAMRKLPLSQWGAVRVSLFCFEFSLGRGAKAP